MRYKDEGNVHLAFHGANNACIKYIREKYGIDALKELFRRVAKDVYQDIHERLKKGDAEALAEHWKYYLHRENADFSIEKVKNALVLRILKCPAVSYLREHGLQPDPAFCEQTRMVNQALSEGTPFTIVTKVLGEGRCIQTIRRNKDDT